MVGPRTFAKTGVQQSWIELLLQEYYDPMYQYQLSKKPIDVIFQGSEFDILDWVKSNMSNTINENSVPG